MSRALLTLALQRESDLVPARQRARQIAALAGLAMQDQTRVATAVSEICRNAIRYAGGGRVQFHCEGPPGGAMLVVTVGDRGPGIPRLADIRAGRYRSTTGMGLGLLGAERLVDEFDVRTGERGTIVTLRKRLPPGRPLDVAWLARELAEHPPPGAADELELQNRELVAALADLRERQEELERLNRELEETNRGVVALYAELDERAARLHRADESKSRFLSHVSHEFRTPVNSIRALTRLLLDRVDGPLTDEQERQVRFVRKAADTLTDLLNDLLDLAKIESGRVAVQVVRVDPASLFGTLRGMLKPLVSNPGVRLVIEDPRDLPVVRWDEAKVAQILRNLVSNALKFTEQGEIRVTAAFDAAADRVAIDVADTGIGIPAEHHARIFAEYEQVDSALQRRVRGTGLGLPLSRRLAELLGGTLELVESRVGAGSRFRVTLPRECAGDARGAAVAVDAYAPAAPRVALVVDDDEASRYLLRRPLEQQGWVVHEAADAATARQLAAATLPAVVMLDLNLPDAPGEQVLAELRGAPGTCRVPVVVVTGRLLSGEERAALDVTDVWTKESLHPGAVPERLRAILPALFDATPAPELQERR